MKNTRKGFARWCLFRNCVHGLTIFVLTMQLQHQANAVGGDCPPIHIRFTARQLSSTKIASKPFAHLKRADIYVWIGGFPADVISLKNASPSRSGTTPTNILFVVPPFFTLNSYTIKMLTNAIDHADNFQLNMAVMAPDGTVSKFSPKTEDLETSLNRAILVSARHHVKRSKWPIDEEAAFVKLRSLSGRHVVVDLLDRVNLFHSQAKGSFITDFTFERLALYDMTQIYQLSEPIPNATAIPAGDASTEHDDTGTSARSEQQAKRLRDLSESQSVLWAQNDPDANPTGGRNEETLDSLFADVLTDAVGSYDSIVQAEAGCKTGQIYSANVSANLPTIRIFVPNFVQIIPAASLNR